MMHTRTTSDEKHDEHDAPPRDEQYEVLFTWDGGDSHHSIEDGLDEFFRGSRGRRVRLPRAILGALLSRH